MGGAAEQEDAVPTNINDATEPKPLDDLDTSKSVMERCPASQPSHEEPPAWCLPNLSGGARKMTGALLSDLRAQGAVESENLSIDGRGIALDLRVRVGVHDLPPEAVELFLGYVVDRLVLLINENAELKTQLTHRVA